MTVKFFCKIESAYPAAVHWGGCSYRIELADGGTPTDPRIPARLIRTDKDGAETVLYTRPGDTGCRRYDERGLPIPTDNRFYRDAAGRLAFTCCGLDGYKART